MEPVVDTELTRISRRIRAWREQAGLTLQELARRSGVATSTIQKVETEQMIPSVAVVLKIARGLGRRTAELVEGSDEELAVAHLRARDRHPFGMPEGLIVERLTGDVFEPSFESWRVTLYPGFSSGRDPIAYAGEELVVCERGALSVRVGETEYALRAGDVLHFKASIPHSWRNRGESPVRFTLTGTLPRKLRAALRESAAKASEGRAARGGGLPQDRPRRAR